MIKYNQIKEIPKDVILQKLQEFMLEDMPNGDKTSDPIFPDTAITTAYFEAEEDFVLSGGILLPYFFGDNYKLEILKKDGELIRNGEVIARVTGPARKILALERTILNLMQRMSGIATITHKMVEVAKPYGVIILDSRKTTPGLRVFEKYSVAVAGGQNHRYNLSAGVLIKDNHIKAAGSLRRAIELIKSHNFGLPIEAEVESDEMIKEAIEAGVDGLLLDNYSPDGIRHCVDLVRNQLGRKDIFLEASGGINFSNLADYVQTGVDAISSGMLTHSVKSANLHLEIE